MSKRILLVDDSRFMRITLTKILEKFGHEIAGEAENGLQGVEKYKELSPHLTLMDITMPEMNGIDAIKEIKKFDPNAQIVVCSAMGQEKMITDAIMAGAKDFIVKPFKTERIEKTLNDLLG